MRGIAVVLAVVGSLLVGSSVAAGPNRTPIRFTAGPQEYNTGAGREWLDQTCYADDHGVSFTAMGWLAGSWSWTTTLPLCSELDPGGLAADKHLTIKAQWKAKGEATIALVDRDGSLVPIRYGYDAPWRYFNGRVESAVGCNTDVSYLWPMQNDELRAPVTFGITTSIPTDVAIAGRVWEMPSPVFHGGEGSWDDCLYPPPGGLNPEDPFG